MAPSGPPAFELPLFQSAGASSSAVCTSCTPGTYSTSTGARGVRFLNGLCEGEGGEESQTLRRILLHLARCVRRAALQINALPFWMEKDWVTD